MKTLCYSLLLMLGAALAGPAAAQTNLAGTWQGRLEVAPGNTLAIQFVIAAKPGGGYSAIVTSPDSGAIKNVPASTVTFADNRLTLDVPALSGGYAGTLRNGVLDGEWSQEGAKLPLSLRPYEPPRLTQADIDVLRGEWAGRLNSMGLEVTVVLRFSTSAGGALHAVLDVPEQGVKDWAGKDAALDAGYFSIELPGASAKITGLLKGDQIVGQWNQFGNPTPLTLKKGRHVPVANYLDLTAEAREQLKGRWSGTLGPLALIVRFETDAQGRTLGFFDSPKQNLPNIPITEAKLAGTKLTFGFAGFAGKYTGDLADGKLTGEWIQLGMPKPAPLVFTRQKDGVGATNAAPVVQELTAQAAAPYLGLYWLEPVQRPVMIVLYKDRLAMEIPWLGVREFAKTQEAHVWASLSNPNNSVKFHRDGDGPATAIEVREKTTRTIKRFEPENGLPSLDELFARRPDRERDKKLTALGTLRMSGSIALTISQQKGSFELLTAGSDRSRLTRNANGSEIHQVVAGKRVWNQYGPSMPVQELPEAEARSIRLSGWLLATGDWRGEFAQARVLKRMDLDGKPVFLTHAAPEQGRQRLVYLDAETGLARGYDEIQEVPGMGMVGCEVRFADYRDIEGVQIPFNVVTKFSSPQLGTWTYQVEKIETGLKLDKDPFAIKQEKP